MQRAALLLVVLALVAGVAAAGEPIVILTSDLAVPPPPAPAAAPDLTSPAQPALEPPPSTVPIGPSQVFSPPAAGPSQTGRAGLLSVPPQGSLPAEAPRLPDAAEPNGPPPAAAAGGVDPASRRLRDVPPPSLAPPSPPSANGPIPQPDSTPAPAAAGPLLVFRTADVVRPDLLRGPNYRLAEYAPLVDFKFQFEIETAWGTIPAHGMAMLALRLRELKSIEYGSRIARKNPMFVEGAVQVAAKTPEGAYLLVTDPIDSVYRTAVGIKRMVTAKWSPNGERANCAARRRLACLLCCDPETRNCILLSLLDDMSANATAGWLTADVALNFGLPGLGALAANAEFKHMMDFKSTQEIQADLDASLAALGVPGSDRTGFLCCDCFTTTQRMAFVYYLRKLVGIERLPALVAAAADTLNESEALASIQELQLLAELRRTHPIQAVSFAGLPIATLSDGSQILVSSADYLVETPRIAELISRYRTEFPDAPATLITLGRVSPGAEQQFLAAGVAVCRHRLGDEEFNARSERAAQIALKEAAAALAAVPRRP